MDQYLGYADMELCGDFYAYRFFLLLDLQYLVPYFIFNTCDANRCIDSNLNHRNGKYARTYLNRMQRFFEDPSLTVDDLRQHRVEAWQRHDADLRTYFAGRNNFFEFDITVSNEQAALCRLFAATGLPHPRQCFVPLWSSSVARRKSMSEVLATIADRRYLGPPALAS